MARLIYTPEQFAEPNLLVPGLAPIGPVTLVNPAGVRVKGYYLPITLGNDPVVLDLAKGKLMNRNLYGSGYATSRDKHGPSMIALGSSVNTYYSDDALPPLSMTFGGMFRANASSNGTENVLCGFMQSENTNKVVGGNCAFALYCMRSYFGDKALSVQVTYDDLTNDNIDLAGTFTAGDVWSFAVSIVDATEIRLAAHNHTTHESVSATEAITKSINQVSQPYTFCGTKPYAANFAWIRNPTNLHGYNAWWGEGAVSLAELVDLARDPFQLLEPA